MKLKLDQIIPELEKEEHFVHLDINNNLFVQLARTECKNIERLNYCPENKIMYIPITTGVVGGMTLKKLAEKEEEEETPSPLRSLFGETEIEVEKLTKMLDNQIECIKNNLIAKKLLAETKRHWTAPKREVLEEAISQEARNVYSDIEKYNRNELEKLYQSLLGWNVLEACTEAYAESFRKDSIILERHNLGDLTEEYKALASFNRRISAQAGYGAKRAERFIQEYESRWRFRGLEKPNGDFAEIKDKVIEKATTHFTK